MNITPEIDAQLAETFACETDAPTSGKGYKAQSVLEGPKSKQRLVIRFDPTTQKVYREGTKNRAEGNRLQGATVTHMVINEGARTPTGGVFTSTRFTVKYDNRTWVGQTKGGTDIVRLRRYI